MNSPYRLISNLDPMTLIYEIDLKGVYQHVKMTFLCQGFQKLQHHRQTDRHRHRDRCDWKHYHTAFTSDNNQIWVKLQELLGVWETFRWRSYNRRHTHCWNDGGAKIITRTMSVVVRLSWQIGLQSGGFVSINGWLRFVEKLAAAVTKTQLT